MALKDYLIEGYEDSVSALSDFPSDDGVSAERLKAIFDGRTDKEVKESINGIIVEAQAELDNKVDKEEGKALSSEDYTPGEKAKLAGIEAGAQVNTVTSVNAMEGDVYIDKHLIGLDRVDNTSDLEKPISYDTKNELNKKAPKANPVFDGKLTIDGVEMYVNEYGDFTIDKPTIEANGATTFALYNGNAEVNGNTVYHDGNLKVLTKHLIYPLTENEKLLFMQNTGLDEILGDIDTALDGIIAMQNELIGGDA